MLDYIVPEYIETFGDCCKVYHSDGEMTHYKKMDSVIKSMYKHSSLNLDFYRDKTNLLLKQKYLTPLIMSHNEILIPIKVRKVIVPRDSSYGYVNFFAIKKIVDNQYLLLHNNQKLFFMDDPRTVKKRIRMAELVWEAFKEELPAKPQKQITLTITLSDETFYDRLYNLILPCNPYPSDDGRSLKA